MSFTDVFAKLSLHQEPSSLVACTQLQFNLPAYESFYVDESQVKG
jgi:hypothetical protein